MEEDITNIRNSNAVLNPYASTSTENNNYFQSNNFSTGYQDVDKLLSQTNELLGKSNESQMQAIDQGVANNINELTRQKEKAEQENLKNNKGLYQEYAKQINPYGVGQESLAGQGLAHSGIAESTKANIFNTYQKSITESLNNLNTVKADYDAKMAEVRSNGDIAKAQALSNSYLQQLEQIKYAWQLAQAQKEFEYNKQIDERNFNYQVGRDTISDQRYADETAYNRNRDAISDQRYADELAYSRKRDSIEDQRYNTEWNYQKQRDKVSDSQWQKEYELSKKNSSSGSKKSSSKSNSSGSKKSSSKSKNSLSVSDSKNSVNVNSSNKTTSNLPDWLIKGLTYGMATAKAITSLGKK